MSLDNSIVEAHVSLLAILTDYEWEWKSAEREFRATIAIDPNYAVAYQYYGYTLLGMGRGEEALVAMKQVAQIDPVSPSVQTSLGGRRPRFADPLNFAARGSQLPAGWRSRINAERLDAAVSRRRHPKSLTQSSNSSCSVSRCTKEVIGNWEMGMFGLATMALTMAR